MSWCKPIICLILVVLMTGCQTPSAYDLWQKAQTYYKAGNYAEAAPLFEQVAALGYPAADYTLGYMYFYGKGTMPDQAVARHYFKRAADRGDMRAVIALEAMGQR